MIEVVDDILRALGTGKWNFIVFFVVSYWFSIVAYYAVMGSFLAPTVEYTCRIPPGGQPVVSPSGNGENNTHIDHCYYIPEGATNHTEPEPCLEWDFDNSTFGNTLTSEFGLVCGRTYLRSVYQSLYMFGSSMAATVGGILADKYGRKRIFATGSIVYFVLSITSCWLPNMSAILVSRFLMGLLHSPTLSSSYILGMEECNPSLRSMVGMFVAVPWGIATVLWGGFAYLIREWRWLQFTVSIPTLLIFPAMWYVDESPRWLVVHGKHEKALKILHKAARWNGTTLPPESDMRRVMNDTQTKAGSMPQEIEAGPMPQEIRATEGSNIHMILVKLKNCTLDLFVLFRTPRLRLITVIVWTNFLLVTTVYYGLTLNAVNFSADPYIYMSITGAMEILAYAFTPIIAGRLGRKPTTIIGFSFSGVCLLILPFIPKELSWLIMVLANAGKLSISAVFQLLFLYSAELFPTEVRLQGFGSGLFLSRVGGMLAPFITNLLGSAYPWAPSVVFGVISAVASCATFLLPETLNRPLPDTIADLENSSPRRRNRSSNDDACTMERLAHSD